MNKNQFRLLLLFFLFFVILASSYDFFWPDPITQQVMDYAYEIEPDYFTDNMLLLSIVGGIAIFLAVISFIGLMFFRNWARHVLLSSFILVLPLYPFVGINVFNGISQIFYDTSMMLSGGIIALLYYSPITNYYKIDHD